MITIMRIPTYNFKAIGQRLKKLRLANKLSAKECAFNIGISRSNYYNIESGLSQNLEITTIKKICALFKITETDFLWGKEDTTSTGGDGMVREDESLYLSDLDRKVVLSMRGMTEVEKRDILQDIEDNKLLKEIKAKKRA